MLKKLSISLVSLYILPAFACEEHQHTKNETNKIEKCNDLNCVREHIDDINVKLVELLAQRMAYVNQAGEIKIKNNVTKAVDNKRAEEVLINAEELGKKEGLPVGFAKNVFQTIVTESAKHEQEHMEKIKK